MITATKRFGSYIVNNDVKLEDIAPQSHVASSTSETERPLLESNSTCAIPSYWTPLTLIEIEPYNHDCSFFRFILPDSDAISGRKTLGLPVGSFLLVECPTKDGQFTIRPYTSVSDDDEIWPVPTGNAEEVINSFQILCKRYDEWGQKESLVSNFLFTKTDHSYRPPGIVSNYIHKLTVGSTLRFKYDPKWCTGKMQYRLQRLTTLGLTNESNHHHDATSLLTLIAVGVGIAPMIHTLRYIFKARDIQLNKNPANHSARSEVSQVSKELSTASNIFGINTETPSVRIVLLYGVVSLSVHLY